MSSSTEEQPLAVFLYPCRSIGNQVEAALGALEKIELSTASDPEVALEVTDMVCDLKRSGDYSVAIGSPPEAYAEATLFLCKKCGQKAFILNAEVAEDTPDTLFGGGSNLENHGEGNGHDARP